MTSSLSNKILQSTTSFTNETYIPTSTTLKEVSYPHPTVSKYSCRARKFESLPLTRRCPCVPHSVTTYLHDPSAKTLPSSSLSLDYLPQASRHGHNNFTIISPIVSPIRNIAYTSSLMSPSLSPVPFTISQVSQHIPGLRTPPRRMLALQSMAP